MRHFINRRTNQVFAYDLGVEDEQVPPDLEPISAEQLAAWRAALVDPKAVILEQIAVLESQITPRRLREAMLSGDHGFIQSVDREIAALRESLTA